MIWQMIEDWFRGILTDGILSNLSGLFDSVNTEVGEIATQVGTTPAGWNAGIFNMIRSLSENVIVPIAGVIITFVMCYELAEPIAPTTAVRLKSGVGKGNKYAATVPGQNQPQKINRPRRKGAYTDEMISPVRSRRNVWQINTASYRGGHFAAFPPKLAETCILAGCPVGGIVLDPFLGSGTTAAAAKSLSRRYVGIEINPEYCTLAKQRIGGDEH